MIEPLLKCKNCGKIHQRRLIACPKCGHAGITKLYKYVPFNEHSLAILKNKRVWFPKASDVNDLFEFKFKLKEMEMNGIPVDQNSLIQARSDAMQLGLFCLSETNDNILMWSHYAQNHTGFCIEFKRSKDNYLGEECCVPVIYPDDDAIPIIENENLESPNTFAKIATTKSKLWAYEKEWRIISRKIGGQTHDFPGDLVGVIFGAKMNLKDIKTIRIILRSSVTYYKAHESDDKYRVNIVEID